MTLIKIALISLGLAVSSAAYAGQAPEGTGHVDTASYAAPEGTGYVDVASYAAPEGTGHVDVA